MKRFIILLCFVFIGSLLPKNAFCNVDIEDRLRAEAIFLNGYLPSMNNPLLLSLSEILRRVVTDSSHPSYADIFVEKFVPLYGPFFTPREVVALFNYLHIGVDKRRYGFMVSDIINFSALRKILILRNALENPRLNLSPKLRNYLEELLEQLKESDEDLQGRLDEVDQLVSTLSDDPTKLYGPEYATLFYKVANILGFGSTPKADIPFALRLNFGNSIDNEFVVNIADDFKDQFRSIPTNVPSLTGFIPGNNVEVFSKNRYDGEYIKSMGEDHIYGLIKPIDPKDERFNPDTSGLFDKESNEIFWAILDTIRGAKKSLFCNLFLFGGKIGGSLAIEIVKKSRELKESGFGPVVILRDFINNFDVGPETTPVMLYLQEEASSEDSNLVILEADIFNQPSIVPPNLFQYGAVGLNLNDIADEYQKNFRIQSNHVKLFSADWNTQTPRAIFGSKNQADHSGGYHYDHMIRITGPAAAVLQSMFYRDLEFALNYEKNRDYALKSASILNEMRVKVKNIPVAGKTVVRFGENNVDGTVVSIQNLNIQAILSAKKYITIEQLFLYDTDIVDALIAAKEKNNNLKIQIIVDPNYSFGGGPLPNYIFWPLLNKYGIEVFQRKTIRDITLKNINHNFFQQDHRKALAIDDEFAIFGSANYTPETLDGNFREVVAEVYDFDIAKAIRLDVEESIQRDEALKLKLQPLNIGSKVIPEEKVPQFLEAIRSILRQYEDTTARDHLLK